MTKMYNDFRGQSFSAPSSSVTLTFALTNTLANVEGDNSTHTATKEPPSHNERETDANIQDKPKEPKQSTDANIEEGKGIASDDHAEDQRKLVKASSIVCPDLDEPEEIKKAKEEARLNAIRKTKVIKVVREEAKKLGIHPKEAITTKAGELFKKAQEAEYEVVKRQHTEKVRKSVKLRKHKNFDVHKPFFFGAFGISELDELREIIPKKKNIVVKDLMKSLSLRYERLRQIPRELGIQSALPASEQAPGDGALVSYLVAASMVKSLENERFSMKLRKLIAEHPDQETLKSKKVKLAALGYNMDLADLNDNEVFGNSTKPVDHIVLNMEFSSLDYVLGNTTIPFNMATLKSSNSVNYAKLLNVGSNTKKVHFRALECIYGHEKRNTMEWLPMYEKLEKAVDERNWLDMMIVYCREFADEHRDFALQVNKLIGDMRVCVKIGNKSATGAAPGIRSI
nr:hypothetical protein [Tanacetum cinerariifolium]